MEEITPYIEIRGKLPTFTTINCVQDNWLWKRIGHTAILYKDTFTGQLMVLESTTLNKFSGKSGVQMMPFGAWLDRYPGKVYARVPKFGDSSPGANAARDIMAADFIKEHLGSSYPDLKTMTGRFKLYMASLDFEWFGWDLFTYKGDDDGIFCTMLVVMMLQACGLFAKRGDAEEYEPDDTRGDYDGFEDHLLNMLYLPEIQLK
jgi:hypothetical protein